MRKQITAIIMAILVLCGLSVSVSANSPPPSPYIALDVLNKPENFAFADMLIWVCLSMTFFHWREKFMRLHKKRPNFIKSWGVCHIFCTVY
jgi:hypothetical protein